MLRNRAEITYLLSNTLALRLKLFVKVNFFYVDAKRLASGYRQRAASCREGRIRVASRREERKVRKGIEKRA